MALQPEQAEHINVVNWFNYHYPYLEDDFHHFANERFLDVKKNPAKWQEGKTLKRMGVKKGVADFFLAYPTNGFAGLWLELKVGKNKPTKEQIAFADRKISRGYQFAFVWGANAAQEMIKAYLKEDSAYRQQVMLIHCT